MVGRNPFGYSSRNGGGLSSVDAIRMITTSLAAFQQSHNSNLTAHDTAEVAVASTEHTANISSAQLKDILRGSPVGLLAGGELTLNGNDVKIAEAYYLLKQTDNDIALCLLKENTLTLSEGINYLIITYSDAAATISISSSDVSDGKQTCLHCVIYKNDTNISITNYPKTIQDVDEIMKRRAQATRSGIKITASGRTFSFTQGFYYNLFNKMIVNQKEFTDTFIPVYFNFSTSLWVTETATNTVSNAFYNIISAGTGKNSLSAAKYAVHNFFYALYNNILTLFMIYSQTSYNSFSEAQDSATPTFLPPMIVNSAPYHIGRAIVQQGVSTMVVQSTIDANFDIDFPVSHTSLTDIGTKAHSQLDTQTDNSESHIASTSNPHKVSHAQTITPYTALHTHQEIDTFIDNNVVSGDVIISTGTILTLNSIKVDKTNGISDVTSVKAKAGTNMDIILGDSIGSNSLLIKKADGTVVGYIKSDGSFYTTGGLSSTKLTIVDSSSIPYLSIDTSSESTKWLTLPFVDETWHTFSDDFDGPNLNDKWIINGTGTTATFEADGNYNSMVTFWCQSSALYPWYKMTYTGYMRYAPFNKRIVLDFKFSNELATGSFSQIGLINTTTNRFICIDQTGGEAYMRVRYTNGAGTDTSVNTNVTAGWGLQVFYRFVSTNSYIYIF